MAAADTENFQAALVKPTLLRRFGERLNARPVLVGLFAWTAFTMVMVFAMPPRQLDGDIFELTGSRYLAQHWWFLAAGMYGAAHVYGTLAAALILLPLSIKRRRS